MKFDKSEEEVLAEVDGLKIKLKGLQDNATLHSTSTGPLVKGCGICARGKSMTFVLGYKCNADCEFCFAPHYMGQKEDDEKYNREACFKDFKRRKDDISGIGLTGGETFLYKDEIGEYTEKIRCIKPDIYFWLYTNGIAANEEDMCYFRDLGISEIRFNLAASGYDKKVIEKVEAARKIFRYVVVEVPSYPKQKDLLYKSLYRLEEIGIDQLTLQELLINEHNAANLEGEGYQSGMIFNKKFFLHGSRKLSYEVMEYCAGKGFSFIINECSTRKFGRLK